MPGKPLNAESEAASLKPFADIDEKQFIHEWIYEIVCSISYDREYIFRSYADNFSKIMHSIFSSGYCEKSGEQLIYGMKSGYNAIVSWSLPRRINYAGLNSIQFRCRIIDKYSGRIIEEHERIFELSCGSSISL